MQRWWLVGAGVIGIALAIVLFPRPDTGGVVPQPDPTNNQPLNFQRPSPDDPGTADDPLARKGLSRPGADPTKIRAIHDRKSIKPEERNGPNPLAAESARKRSQPEAVYAGRASAPFTLIRRELLREDTDESRALAEEMTLLITDLRSQRRDPDSFEWGALETRMKESADKLRGTNYESNADIAQSLVRLDDILNEYHESAAQGGTPEE